MTLCTYSERIACRISGKKSFNRNGLQSKRHLTDSFLEILFTALGQLYFYVVPEGDWCVVVVLVMSEVIQVDQVGFMGAEESIARQAVFNFFQDLGEHVFSACGGNDLGIPALSDATKNIFHPEKFDSPGGLNRYFQCIHTLTI
jgi:hypothetical protein